MFNLSVVVYEDSKEFVVGNAQLPIEDIVELISGYRGGEDAKLNRVLFIYGTNFSQRENCIIGKMNLEINYYPQKQFLREDELAERPVQQQQHCFLHRETYINRKIPLNANIAVYIERILNLKESIENIEHFSKVTAQDPS